MSKIAGKDAKILTGALGTEQVVECIEAVDGIYIITTTVDNGYALGQWIKVLAIDTTNTLDGYWKVSSIQGTDVFTIDTPYTGLVSSDTGTSEGFTTRPAYECMVDLTADEIDVTQFGDSDWREFLAGFNGADVTLSHYLDDDEVPYNVGTELVLYFILGRLEIVTTLKVLTRGMPTDIDDAVKVDISGRATGLVIETII